MTSMQTTATQRDRPLSRIKKRRAPARRRFTLATPQTRTTRAKKTEESQPPLQSQKKRARQTPTPNNHTSDRRGRWTCTSPRKKQSYVQLKCATAATSHSPTRPRRRRRSGGSNPNHPTRIAMCKKKIQSELTEGNRRLCSIHVATPNLLSALVSSASRGFHA